MSPRQLQPGPRMLVISSGRDGSILWLRPAVEWTVLLWLKTSKEKRGEIGEQAGGGREKTGSKRALEAVQYNAGMDGLTVWS